MGLSATQVRLLSLTARQHSVEYEAQKIQAQKLQLANESDRVYQDYLTALDATKVQYKKVEDDGSFTYDDATFGKLQAAGFLFNVNGTICESFDEVRDVLNKPKDQGGLGLNITASDTSYTLLSTLVSEGLVVIMQQLTDPESGYTYKQVTGNGNDQIILNEGTTKPDPNDPTKEVDAAEYFSLNEVDVHGSGKEYAYKVFGNTSVTSSTKLDEVSDDTSLKKSEAQYEADMNRINAKDKRYDNELSQLETERNAIKTELETLENVAKDNVDRTFKLFA